MKYIDLHTHTCYSDGTSTVTNSLENAKRLGLSVFSVTDHNTVAAYDEISKKRDLFDGEILTGVELSAFYNGEVIEILGYGIDITKMGRLIYENYPSFFDKQVMEARFDTEAMLNLGVTLDDGFVKTMMNTPEKIFDPSRSTNRPFLLREIQRHPENARFFKDNEEFISITEGRFTREYLFNVKSSLYSDQSPYTPDIDKAIKIIHDCGGLAFLAHLFIYSSGFENNLKDIITHKIDGIECHYGTFTADQKAFCEEFCELHGLYKSGGSDFHGTDMRPQNPMGLSDGEMIPLSIIEQWRRLL